MSHSIRADRRTLNFVLRAGPYEGLTVGQALQEPYGPVALRELLRNARSPGIKALLTRALALHESP